MVVLERDCRNLGFEKIMSPTSFKIIAWTHARFLYSYPRLMIGHFEEVGLSMNLGNIMELGRPTFPKIFVRPHAWLLYSFLIQIFLLWVVKKEYMKHDVKKFVNIVSRACFVGTQA